MRGSVYFQSAELIKCLYVEGAKKIERIDPNHKNYESLGSYLTAKAYRDVWNNMFLYLAEHWKIKDTEKITSEHVAAYMSYKSEYHVSHQYLQKINAAMRALEIALNRFSLKAHGVHGEYDFSIRQIILNESRNMELIADNYHNRAYAKPMELIYSLAQPIHRLAAFIEYEGGARLEGCALIKREQLQGYRRDPITKVVMGVIKTREKGGKEGNVRVLTPTYEWLKEHILEYGRFKIDRQQYAADIRTTCGHLEIKANGSHGLRWNFAKRRIMEYARAGYTYEQSLQGVSWEMKHNRASITEHYLGG